MIKAYKGLTPIWGESPSECWIMDQPLRLKSPEDTAENICAIFILLYNNNLEIEKLEVIALQHQSRSVYWLHWLSSD